MKYIGIDLGGTNIKAVILDVEFTVLDRYSVETRDSGNDAEVWKNKIKTYVQNICSKFSNEEIRCGIAAPGLANEKNSMILWMPGRLNGLENFQWMDLLGLPVYVLNDAHAACMAEWKLGAGKNTRHMLMLTLGTGVGGATILNGELYQGAIGRAGHVGHTTVDYKKGKNSTNMAGSLEDAIGNLSIKERTLGEFDDTRKLVDAYKQGHAKATEWWLDSIHKLAVSLCSLINVLDPEMIVIGGGIANANEALFDPLNDFMKRYEWIPGKEPTLIKKAELGEYAGAIGAAIFTKLKHTKI